MSTCSVDVAASVFSDVEETIAVLVLENVDVCPLVSDSGVIASFVSIAEERKAVLVSEHGDVRPIVSEIVVVASAVADFE